jgi:type I restriction enzyme R subunit
LQLVNPDLNEAIYSLIEAAELDPEQEAKLDKELGRQYHLITRNDRLETIAQDITTHFLGRGFPGKAMVIAIDKATALKMHDKVKKNFARDTIRVRQELEKLKKYKPGTPPVDCTELERRLALLTTTDMALIVSPGQNEIEQMPPTGSG